MIDANNPWPISQVSGHQEPPKLHWLLDYLKGMAQPGVDPKRICHHAHQIHVAALCLAAELTRRFYKIKSVSKGPVEVTCRETAGLHELTATGANAAEDEKSRLPPPKNFLLTRLDNESLEYSATFAEDTRGLSAALQRLERAAKSGSLERWLVAWAGVTDGVHKLVTAGLPLPSRVIPKSWIPVHAPGMHMTVPPAIEALPAILAARKKHQAIPGAERKKRTGDLEVEQFYELLGMAFSEITGKEFIAYWDNHACERGGDGSIFARDIAAKYGIRRLVSTSTWHFRKLLQKTLSR